MSTTDLRTPAKITRGLGAAKEGTTHFIHQRVTAIALLVLIPWFVISGLLAAKGGYETTIAWIASPWNAIPLILTFGAAFYHMRLGMQTVIEDYIGKSGTRQALLILNTFIAVDLFAIASLSVLKIWFSAG